MQSNAMRISTSQRGSASLSANQRGATQGKAPRSEVKQCIAMQCNGNNTTQCWQTRCMRCHAEYSKATRFNAGRYKTMHATWKNAMQNNRMSYETIQSKARQYDTIECTAMQRNLMQHGFKQYGTSHHTLVFLFIFTWLFVFIENGQRTIMRLGVLSRIILD